MRCQGPPVTPIITGTFVPAPFKLGKYLEIYWVRCQLSLPCIWGFLILGCPNDPDICLLDYGTNSFLFILVLEINPPEVGISSPSFLHQGFLVFINNSHLPLLGRMLDNLKGTPLPSPCAPSHVYLIAIEESFLPFVVPGLPWQQGDAPRSWWWTHRGL